MLLVGLDGQMQSTAAAASSRWVFQTSVDVISICLSIKIDRDLHPHLLRGGSSSRVGCIRPSKMYREVINSAGQALDAYMSWVSRENHAMAANGKLFRR